LSVIIYRMTEQQLINQLKTLKNIHPEQNWVHLTRGKLTAKPLLRAESLASLGINSAIYRIVTSVAKGNLLAVINRVVPSPVAVSTLAAIVMVVGVVSVVQEGQIQQESGLNFASVSKIYPFVTVDLDAGRELEAIAKEAAPNGEVMVANPQDGSYTVIFKEDADSTERFKRMLKDRIEVKIYEVSQEAEELSEEELKRQVESLLQAARKAFAAGELIEALELVTAAEKLLR